MSVRGFRDSFRSYIPKWLSNRLDRNVGYRFLYALIMPIDVMMQGVLEGVQAALPGYGTPTALPLIGRSRGILRGEVETDDAYAARQRAWLTTWTEAGSSERIAKEIHNYFGNHPMIRIVDRAGKWVTVAADGTVTETHAAWDWDSVSNPERSGDWSDLWIIVYPSNWIPITGDGMAFPNLSALVGVWGTHELGTGHQVFRLAVQSILGLVEQFKGAHTFVRAIIWSYDVTLFDPASPVVGDPDGKWGYWGKPSGSSRVVARNPTCRYWIPTNG